MSYIGSQPADSYLALSKQDFTTSATTTYTLSNSVTSASDIALFINFVRQEPTTAYSASGTTLTLTEATSASDDMYCIYLGRTVGTINPPNGSVDSSKINYPLTTFSSTGIDDNATANALTIDSSSNLQFNSGYGSVATAYGCRAWINFDGTGTISIRSSGNISSISDKGTGTYTINFDTAMPDNQYAFLFSGRSNSSTALRDIQPDANDTISSSSIDVRVETQAGTEVDISIITMAVFR